MRIGFESRLTVLTVDGEEVSVVMSRTEQRSLGVTEGSTVWVTPAPGAIVVPSMRVGRLTPIRGNGRGVSRGERSTLSSVGETLVRGEDLWSAIEAFDGEAADVALGG